MSSKKPQSTDDFVGAFHAKQTSEPDADLKPFWLDAMRVGNRRRELETLSPALRTFIPGPVLSDLDDIWRDTKVLTDKWSNQVVRAPATDIPGDIAAIGVLLNRANVINRNWFGQPHRTAIRLDNRVVLDSQLYNQIYQLRSTLNRDAFVALITDQVNTWTSPPLRVWFKAMDVPAVANGRIRLQSLGQVAGVNVHLTNYLANVDQPASIRGTVASIMDDLFPPAGADWRGTHVTMELFAQDSDDNPKFFKGRGWYTTVAANAEYGALGGVNAVRNGLAAALTGALNGYQADVQNIMNTRLTALI
jgi:hypothetical protein